MYPKTLLASLAFAFVASLASGQPCVPGFTHADAVLATHVSDLGLPGAGIAVFDGAGASYLERYLGTYGPNTFVPIASSSKAVSAAVIMSLVDDGTLSLDDTVETHLPQHAGTPNGAVTVRQAFSQTSGLWNDDWPCLGDTATTLAACVEDILNDAPRIAAPGAMFFYGGDSMHVAARIAEVAYCERFPERCTGLGSGAIWNKIFRERLRDPLGLAMFYNSATNPRVAGGIVSRLSDYRKFWRMILNRGEVDGVRVLSAAAVDEMTRDQTAGARVYYSAAQPDVRYGLGIWRFTGDSASRTRVLSDPGKFGFHPWYDLDTSVGGIVMLNDPEGAARNGGRHVALQIERIVHDVLTAGAGDADGDGACAAADLCPSVYDPSQADTDGDGAGDACDCAVTDPRTWAVPGETARAIFYGPPTCLDASYNHATGNITCWPTTNLFDWFQPDAPGAIATDLRYDILLTPQPADWSGPATCAATAIDRNGPYNDAYLAATPPPGGLFAYLPRASNACGTGSTGYASDGTERPPRACP